ncbi:MAG: cytochrome c5 family protein, partial [Rubrivivax sp.]
MPGPSAGPACAAAPATVAAADPGPDVQPAIVGTAPLRSRSGHWPDEAACAAQAAALAARPE